MVVDVVEGTAMAALSNMQMVLSKRPTSFPSIEAAVMWGVSSGNIRNLDSARVSLPSQV